MNQYRYVYLLWVGIALLLIAGLQNCKKDEPAPTTPSGPGSTTTTPGTSTTATTATRPRLTDITVTGIGSTSARVSATISNTSNEAITYHGFAYYVGDVYTNVTEIKLGTTTGPFPFTFSATLTGLLPNTAYTVLGRADFTGGSAQSQVKFTTPAAQTATVRVGDLSQNRLKWVTDYSAQFTSISATYLQGAKLDEAGVCYSESKPLPTTADSKATGAFSSSGIVEAYFNSEPTGLKASTVYYTRPYAIVNGETYYGGALQVTTQARLSGATVANRANFPGIAHSNPVEFSLGGKYYTGATQRAANGSTIGTFFFEYDPNTDRWTQKGNIPITNTSGSIVGAKSGVMYVANGKGYFGFSTDFTANTELWEYDPTTDKWTRVASGLTNPLRSPAFILHSQVQIGSKVYLIGMESAVNSVVRFYEYDIATRTFALKTLPAGTNLSGNELASFDNTIYFYKERTLAAYNAASNTWTTKNQLPNTASGNDNGIRPLQAVGGKLYGLGQEVFEYNPTADSWRVVLKLSVADAIKGNAPFTFEQGNRLFHGNVNTARWVEFKP